MVATVARVPILLATAVIAAAAADGFAQRASGLGFSLIAAPSLALAAGPRDGVAMTNLLALVVALAVLATSARRLDPARAAILVPAGLAGVVPGTLVFRLLPAGLLQVTVGTVTGLGLAAAAVARRRLRAEPRRRLRDEPGRLRDEPRPATTAVAGLASGFSSAVAGAGGPPLTIYAVTTGWSQPLFAATGQVSYAAQAATAVMLKGIPPVPIGWLCAAVAATLGGVATAHLLSHRINPAHARRAALGIAAVATAVTTVHGIALLAGL